jgi:hypothetical protein
VESDDRTSGRNASATLRLQVPPTALAGTLAALDKLGTETARQVSSTDVTGTVADVTSRVASARDAIARLRTLYDRASKVSDVLAVEGELSSQEADLESLEAQARALASETSLATITLTLVTAPVATPPHKHNQHRGGFLGGLQRGWDGLVAAAGWVAGALGTLLPFLAVLAAFAVVGRLGWARLAHRRGRESAALSE